MATKVNEILQFASQDTGSNLLTQSEYDGDAQRVIGHQPGIARSRLENKVLRQCSTMSAGLAEFMLRNQDGSITDGMTPQEVADALTTAVGGLGATKIQALNVSITTNPSSDVDVIIPNNLYSMVDIIGDSTTLTIGLIAFQLKSRNAISANTIISSTAGINIAGKTPVTALVEIGTVIIKDDPTFAWANCGLLRSSTGNTVDLYVNGKVLQAINNAGTGFATGRILFFTTFWS